MVKKIFMFNSKFHKLFMRSRALALVALLILVSMSVGVGVNQQNVLAAASLPCDIYAAAGTPCVAAHSTTRALFGAYSGNLYQVKRASDGATTNIGTLAVGGYANASTQDAFCSGTSCTITIIYDQSSRHNDLTISPAGGAGGADVGAVANALPVTAGGHPAYGVYVTPGTGYRDLAATGTAVNGGAEGMYMVTSGTYVNGGCCFDYGNTEQPLANDTGNGHMDAVYFGLRCEHAPCSGSGPWIAADLENGLFQGNGSNTGDATVNFDVVTAMLKNNGQTTFALKTGNAQSGGLTTQYNGTLPTGSFTGYTPMHQEGGIVLGVGGDNSNASAGWFLEGVMTSGYPTDAAENSVQANIVSVGYIVPTYTQIVPTSETTAQSWKYTTTAPASNWNTTGFSDSAWSTGNGGFGTAGTPGAVIGTTWNTADIWLRRTFNPGNLTPLEISNLVFRLHHDEDAELYINGALALQAAGYSTGYYFAPLTTAGQNAIIQNGSNLLAIHVHQTTGGQYIDAGIYAKTTFTQVVPTSETTAQSWKYTTTTPASNWNTTGFSDGAWSTGNGGFGTAGTPGAVIGTTWNTADIWLRRTFNPGSLSATQISNMVFRLHHDEDAELYINGTLALQAAGYSTGYYYAAMTTAGQNAIIQNGSNLLAIHVHQTTGGQYIDAGIFTQGPVASGNPTATPTFVPPTSTPLPGGAFSTGLESGNPQPTWINTVETVNGGISNVGGICCGLTGPELGVRNETAHAGTAALMYSGLDNSATSSFAYMEVFSVSVPVTSTSTLSYWIYPQSTATSNLVSGSNSTCVSIDMVFSDGSNLRDSGVTDQSGNKLHPASQCGHLTLDQWNHVTANLGSLNGKTISRINVAYDQPANTGGYRGYIDDISVATSSAPAWDSNSHAYAVGDLVTYLGHTYKCITAHVSQPAWDPVDAPSLWQLVS